MKSDIKIQEEGEDLRTKKYDEEVEQSMGIFITMKQWRKTKTFEYFMWVVKKQGYGGSYMATSWWVCKVHNLVC